MQMLIAVRSIARLDDCQIAEKPQTTKQLNNKTTKQQKHTFTGLCRCRV